MASERKARRKNKAKINEDKRKVKLGKRRTKKEEVG